MADLADATRGAGAHASDPANTCYLIHDGSYVQSGATLPFYVRQGGVSATARRLFIGQSRAGVVIQGRGTIDTGISHVLVSNMTFTLTGYSQSGSFNTFTVLDGTDVVLDHMTFTGDCATGSTGGAVEVDGTTGFVLQSSLVEKFGHCASGGHLDHGVYISSGNGIAISNNEIRLNSSRGIQLNTEDGSFGTIDNVTITGNRIHGNGHADYEDGIVLNGGGAGTIAHVTIQNNLIYGNYYSGIRVVDVAYATIVISQNTLSGNGVAAAGPGKSEMNIDSFGCGANTNVTRNIISAGYQVLNDCYDALSRKYALVGNVVQGAAPTGEAGNCISQSVVAAPMFVNAVAADFHTQNAAVAAYGAYASSTSAPSAVVPALGLPASFALGLLLCVAGMRRFSTAEVRSAGARIG
ncbi:MAG TPA: right-handed parallel beta-helix repeat-containing protein [Polyangia bacterium]|nr:right-handed parallel beta-helix repeat-containing protein [Polyangia bacterium]